MASPPATAWIFSADHRSFPISIPAAGIRARSLRALIEASPSGADMGFVAASWGVFLAPQEVKSEGAAELEDRTLITPTEHGGEVNVWVERVVAPAAAPAVPSGRAAPGGPLTFEALLIAGGLPAAHLEPAVVRRARLKYGPLVVQAGLDRNPAVALEAYELAKLLPSTTTVTGLRIEGYKLNGLLYEGSELTVCYRGERVHLLKGLRDEEAARARIFRDTCGEPVPHVTPYELISTAGGKHFMIMPKFATALEPLPYLSAEGVTMLWEHMQQALEGLHARGFAHADIKPANICLTEDGGSAILIDLGSVARVGERTSSTPAYVPRDVARGRASPSLDWWMLAMTLAEKACGPDHQLEMGGYQEASKAELRAHLAVHLSPAVWAALGPKLVD